jgi:hypothetical protein
MFKLLGRTITVAVLTVPVAVGLAGPASADTSASGPSPAVVGPLLNFFYFGDNIGAPLVCSVVAAAVGDGAAEYGFATEASTLVNAINSGCASFSAEGAQVIAMGQADDSPLAAINPYANPVVQSTGSSVTQAADTAGPAINPFGPTVAGLGGTIEWFEGN